MEKQALFSVAGVSVGILLTGVPLVQAAAYTDNFESYVPGGLGGQGGYSGSTASRIDVVSGGGVGGSQGLVITGQQAVTVNTTKILSSPILPAANIMTATFDVQAGSTNGSTMWSFQLNDSVGKNLARVYTGSGTVRGRIDGLGVVTPTVNLSGPGIWDKVRITMDTSAKTSFFELSLNGGAFTPFGGTAAGATLVYDQAGNTPVASQISQVYWEATGGSGALPPGVTISFDNLSLVPEPTAALILLAGTGAWVGRRRSRLGA